MSDRHQAHRDQLAELAAARRELRRREHELVTRTRAAALHAVTAGMPEQEVAALAGVSAATLERWATKARVIRARASAATGVDARVLAVLHGAAGPLRNRDVSLATGLRTGTVSKSVRRLAATGRLIRNPDGTFSPVLTAKRAA